MKKITIFLFLLLCVNSYAQSLKGKITNTQGEPVEYATIYVVETKTGSISTGTGDFILSLTPGTYTCIVQHMNYQTVTKTVEISKTTFMEVKMEAKNIQLKEVSVSAKDEDMAYRVIRNTVAKSPYYRKQLLTYKANFYAKGTLKVKDAPKLMNVINKFLKEENKIPIKKNDIFTEESVSEVTVKPNKTEQKVISKRTTYPEQLDINFERFTLYNIYRTYENGFVSPVTKDGLSIYRYSLDHTYQEGDNLIYHIKVTPKNNSPLTFSGFIDIIDGSWHVYNFDLKGSIDFGFGKAKFTFKQNYVPVEKNIWMPGSFKTNFDVKAMGFHFDLNTTHSVRYKDYTINPELSSSKPPADEPRSSEKKPVVSKKSEKLTKEIAEMMNKENLTTRETIKLVELMESKNKEELKNNTSNDSVKPLEIERRFFLTVDSNALKYDSLQWETYRTIPLSEEELGSFEQKRVNDSIKEEKKKFSLLDDIQIKKKKSKNKTFFFGVSPRKSVLAFNTVDGFKLGVHVYANKRFKDSVTTLNNGVTLGFAFASKKVFFDLSSKWNYDRKRFASLELFGGMNSFDFKKEHLEGKYLMNTISSLYFRDNLIQFYDRSYVGVKHNIEIFHSFQMACALSYEQLHPLDNRSNYSFFFRKKRDYHSNIPDNKYVANNLDYLSAQNALLLDISLSYTPRMFYRYSQNKKIKYYVRSKFPTFTISWKKGIKGTLGSKSNFDYLELNIAQKVNFKLSKSLTYSVTTGFFPNTKNIHFSQFKQFQTNNFWVTLNTFSEIFNTMPNYKYATNEWFVAGHVKYETLYLLLKFIPGLNKTLITENIHLSLVSNPLTKSYFEVGYSLSRIFFVGNIGFFAGFDEFKTFNWSVRVGFSLPFSP